MSEEPNGVTRHSTRPRKVNEQFKESYQELKGSSNKKFNQKIEKYQMKKQTTQRKNYEFGFKTEWLRCLYPEDNGQTYDLQIQFGVLQQKRPSVKKVKSVKEDGVLYHIMEILSILQNLLTNVRSDKHDDLQIQEVINNGSLTTVYHPYFKKCEYRCQGEESELPPIKQDENLTAKFNAIKKTFKPLILH